MTLKRLLNRPIEILPYQEGEVDEYNDSAPEYGDAVEVLGYFEQTAEDEDTQDRETSASDGLLVLPADSSLTYKDRVRVAGTTYEVDGTVNEVWNPRRQIVNHIEARLRRIEG